MNDSQAPHEPDTGFSRRQFLKTTTILTALPAAAFAGGCASTRRADQPRPQARGPKRTDTLRVGLIGCGGRGTGAAKDCVAADPQVEIVALGDIFADRVTSCRSALSELGPRCQVRDNTCFSGLDSYRKVLACDLDLVILATPPGFRPPHLKAAIESGRHVFMEKPVAVDPVGVRTVIAASELAEQKGLAIVSGTQRRHDPAYLTIMKRIQGGAIGKLVAGQCYWNQGDLWVKPREPGWTDLEWQCRNWLYFTWLSGDHIVEQHVHNIDVMNWAMGSPPAKCIGMGGRQTRTGAEFGNIFDHFAVEYEYPNGARVLSMCRQVGGASDRVSERLVGTSGVAQPDRWIRGWTRYEYKPKGEPVNPYVQEHVDLIRSIRDGRPLNEGRRIAESTLTAIMGRMSAYTGRELSWEWALKSSQLDLMPPADMLAGGAVGMAPVAVPGKEPLV